MTLNLRLFYTPEEIAKMFLREGNLRWVYRHASPRGFLRGAVRKFGRRLLFSREVIDRLTNPDGHP